MDLTDLKTSSTTFSGNQILPDQVFTFCFRVDQVWIFWKITSSSSSNNNNNNNDNNNDNDNNNNNNHNNNNNNNNNNKHDNNNNENDKIIRSHRLVTYAEYVTGVYMYTNALKHWHPQQRSSSLLVNQGSRRGVIHIRKQNMH